MELPKAAFGSRRLLDMLCRWEFWFFTAPHLFAMGAARGTKPFSKSPGCSARAVSIADHERMVLKTVRVHGREKFLATVSL